MATENSEWPLNVNICTYIGKENLLAQLSLERYKDITSSAIETVRLILAESNVRLGRRFYTAAHTRLKETTHLYYIYTRVYENNRPKYLAKPHRFGGAI